MKALIRSFIFALVVMATGCATTEAPTPSILPETPAYQQAVESFRLTRLVNQNPDYEPAVKMGHWEMWIQNYGRDISLQDPMVIESHIMMEKYALDGVQPIRPEELFPR